MKNLNDVARVIALMEHGKKQVNIAQVKEILKDLGVLMHSEPKIIAMLLTVGSKFKQVKVGTTTSYKGFMR